jgi:hypothetical protein
MLRHHRTVRCQGVILLVFSLVSDAATATLEDSFMSKHKIGPFTMMLVGSYLSWALQLLLLR